MKNRTLQISAILLFGAFLSCSKDGSQPGARTVSNLSGTYNVTSLIVSNGSINVDEYPALPDCEKGNTIVFNANLTINFNDLPPVCSPPTDSTANWSLSANTDTIYIATGKYFIDSWDGTTLVVNSNETYQNMPVQLKTTLVKQK